MGVESIKFSKPVLFEQRVIIGVEVVDAHYNASCISLKSRFTRFAPINPAEPVTSIFIVLFVCLLVHHKSSAYASPTLRLWYAYGTNHIFESRLFPFSSCSKFGTNSRMAFLRQALRQAQDKLRINQFMVSLSNQEFG